MRSSLPTALDHVRAYEGGYVNHPRDPGGCTNLGITLATYRRHLDSRGTCAGLKRLKWPQAAEIYRRAYWAAVNGDDLPAGLDLLVFDMGVNAGPGTAIRLLQQVLEVEDDGVIGPKTLAALSRRDPLDLVDSYSARRITYYRRLKTWTTFGLGWTRRTQAAKQAARALLAEKKSP